MSPTKRQPNPVVIRQILEQPGHYNFWQATRILERAVLLTRHSSAHHPDWRSPTARQPLYAGEWIRFGSAPSMSFPSTDIDEILTVAASGPVTKNSVHYRVSSRILSLVGATGVLPFHYTDFVHERLQLKDRALMEFLDIFHHRLLTLYYRAGTKFRIALAYEDSGHGASVLTGTSRSTANPAGTASEIRREAVTHNANSPNHASRENTTRKDTGWNVSDRDVSDRNVSDRNVPDRNVQEKDSHSRTLFALAGITAANLRELSICPESLLYYTGFFSQKVRSVASLRKLLSHYFSVGIEIEEFVASWEVCPDEYRSQLAGRANRIAANNRLGGGSVLGHRLWSVQNKARIVIGPLDEVQARTFAPGSTALRSLDELVQLYAGAETAYEYVLRIAAHHVPLKTRLQQRNSPVLGWNVWLARSNHRDQHFDLAVAVKRN